VVTQESLGGDLVVTPPPTTQSPKRENERYTLTDSDTDCMAHIWKVFPKRDVPPPYAAFVAAFRNLRIDGVPYADLVQSAHGYAAYVTKNSVEPKYVKTIHRFYMDDSWKSYCVKTVLGRTREEWARSGQDVAEFDKLADSA